MKRDKIPEAQLPEPETDTNEPMNDNGKKPKPPRLLPNSWETAVTHSQNTTALDILALPGKEILDLMMRAKFASKRTDGHRQVRAMMEHIAKMKEFHCRVAEVQAMMVVAGDVSIDGEGRDQVVRAVTADFSTRQAKANAGNVGEWLQKTAGVGKYNKNAGAPE